MGNRRNIVPASQLCDALKATFRSPIVQPRLSAAARHELMTRDMRGCACPACLMNDAAQVLTISCIILLKRSLASTCLLNVSSCKQSASID